MPEKLLSAMLPSIKDPDLEYRKYVNFLVALRERRKNATVVSARPFDITADMSTACHLHCPYCATGNKTIDRAPMQMTPAVHDDMLGKLGDTLFVVWYFSTGEPFLNPRLPELVAQARGKEIFSCISTNLSMPLGDERIDAILRSGLGLISVSLDGASQETYSQYRRGGDFQLVLNNLRRMAQRKRELGLQFPLLEWRFLLFQHNEHEVEAARRMAEEIGVDSLEFFYGYAPENAPPQDVCRSYQPIVGPSESGPALQQGLERRDTTLRSALGPDMCSPSGAHPSRMLNKKCDWLYYSSMIYPDGQVGPCCVAVNRKDDFGALTPAEPFHELWNNRNYQLARGLFTGAAAPDLVCSRCTQPLSRDLQFSKTINGVLGNAPDWVVVAIAAEPDAFLYEIDYVLLPCAAALRQMDTSRLGPFPDIVERLRNESTGDASWQESVQAILSLLTRTKRRSWWRRAVACVTC